MATNETRKGYSAVDLFSGCGGLSLGLERAGFDVRAAVEIDSVAATTYRTNHPRTAVIQDNIRNVGVKDLRRAARIGGATLDLLAGCPPCQGFSRLIGRNRPIGSDPRNDFVLDYLRLARGLRPKMILLENVPGLAKDRRFKRMLKELHGLGYKTDWAILNAAHFGVPQRRERLIMMASLVGDVRIPKGSGVRKTVRECIEDLMVPRLAADPLHRMHLKCGSRIMKLIAKIPRDGGSRAALERRAQLNCHKRIQGFNDVYGRMKWDDVAPTLTGGCYNPSKGRFLHPSQNRPITLREAALLQTFPRRYRFPHEAGLSAIARMIGDALPPLFGKAQGRHLVKHLISSATR